MPSKSPSLARTFRVWSIVLPLNMANLRRGSPVRVELGSRTLGARRSAPGAHRKLTISHASFRSAPIPDIGPASVQLVNPTRSGLSPVHKLRLLHASAIVAEGWI